MRHTKSYIAGHPRPQFTREKFLSLDGEWDLCFDDENRGVREKYWKKFPAGQTIKVPYAYQSEASGVADKARHPIVWYRKKADVSAVFVRGGRVLLHFEGADYLTDVWVNGQHIGSHEGGYARFSFDVTDFLQGSTAEIVVRCEDTDSCIQPRGKQKWEKDIFGCWYTETTGIWKSVWAEGVSDAYLLRAKTTTDISEYFVRFDYEIARFCEGLSLKTVISFGGSVIAEDECKVVRPSFARRIDLTSETDPFKKHFWFPHDPALYDVEFILCKDGKACDRVRSYFGLVNYGTVKNNITVNDYPVYLKMVLDQGYFPGGWLTPTEEQLAKDVSLIRGLGLNGVRKHQKLEDERFYYYCDVCGLYVWLEMPSAYEFGDGMMETFSRQWAEILRQYGDHPSVMALVPFNESWGVQRIFSDRRQQEFTEAMVHLGKALLPGRLVISNDGWEHTESDVVTLHNYAENGEGLSRVYDGLKENLANEKTSAFPHKFAFARGYAYAGQPVVVSEFAGIAFEKDKERGWGYGSMVQGEKEYLERLASLIAAIGAEKGFSGYCITQLTDVQHEINGLFDFMRCAKVDEEKLKSIL